jgi:hypothetical protein
MDNTWLCIKKFEGHPGKIYFDGCLTESSQIEEIADSALGSFVFIVRNIDMSDEKRSSLSQGVQLDGGAKDNAALAANSIEVGFDTSEDMLLWRNALQEQISSCSE